MATLVPERARLSPGILLLQPSSINSRSVGTHALSVPDEAEQIGKTAAGKTAAFRARLCFSDEKTGANQETIPSRSGIAERWSIIFSIADRKTAANLGGISEKIPRRPHG
jgi:hypothetical protein